MRFSAAYLSFACTTYAMWFTFLLPSFLVPMVISFALRKYCLEMREISGLMVAENISVFRSSGTFSRIELMLSVNPMFSISSASSITTLPMVSSLATFRSIRSISRPGVATIMCTPLLSMRIWLSMDEPPYTGRTFSPSIYLE